MNHRTYRGKRVDNGEWVFGYLCTDSKEKLCIQIKEYLYQVIQESVGQCTGLQDKNGNLIFEGDFLIDELNPNWQIGINCKRHPIEKVLAFYQGSINNEWMSVFSDELAIKWVIIGNIHDNPSFLTCAHISPLLLSESNQKTLPSKRGSTIRASQ